MDVERLKAEADNAPLIMLLARAAVPRTPGNASPWDIDDYELHVHPDIVEVIEQATRPISGAAIVPVYGCVVSARRNVAFAFARGTGWVALRVPANELDRRLRPVAATELGTAWSMIDWAMSDVPLPDGRAILAAAFRQAADRIPARGEGRRA